MLFKTKFAACLLAICVAVAARAQDNAAQNQKDSQVGKARTQADSQPTTGENQNRRRDNNANQPSDAQNRNANAQDRNKAGSDQNRNQRETTTQRTETREIHANAGDKSPIDSQLASCLLIGNQKEVTISQFAAERAKNDKVKEFARQMVKDHTQAISMLQRFAGPDASKDLSTGDAGRVNRSETTVRSTTTTDSKSSDSNRSSQDNDRNANRDNNNRRSGDNQKDANRSSDSAAASDAARGATNQADRDANVATAHVRSEHEAMPDKMLAIQKEVAQKCIAMAKQELEQSNNFDQAYVGMQIAEHMGMIAHLETYKSYASPELGKVIQESLDTAQGHLRHAKELVMEIGHDQLGNNRNSPSTNANSGKANSNNSSSDSNNRKSGRDGSNNSTNRDDATPRREGVFKKDAPKS